MNEETKPPEGLELAETLCGHAFCAGECTEDQMCAAVDAIRDEHTQRLTLQRQAADLAQRVADLERLCDMYKTAWSGYTPLANYMQGLANADKLPGELGGHYGDVAIETIKRLIRQSDELRARLAELGQQEPVAVSVVATVGRAKDGLHLRWLIEGGLEGLECGCTLLVADRRISGDDGSGEVYARPAPAIPPGWKLVPVNPTREQWVAGGTAAREYMKETGRNNPAIIYTAMIAVAPEHKA